MAHEKTEIEPLDPGATLPTVIQVVNGEMRKTAACSDRLRELEDSRLKVVGGIIVFVMLFTKGGGALQAIIQLLGGGK